MNRIPLSLLLALSASCSIENPTHECGNGIVCPASLACDMVHETCVPPEDLEACAGQAELAACTTRLREPGSCFEGLCVPAACGNGIEDTAYGEACDDGNALGGDGCSSQCTLEACGNNARDGGEECDDGNLRSHDGCDSACKTEVLRWTAMEQVATPSRAFAAHAYDTLRGRLVLFGGTSDSYATPLGDTFEWNGVAWRKIVSTSAPTPRHGAAMAYDSARHVTVLFGGRTAAGARVNDTWTWDGKQWTQQTPQVQPPARSGHVMAYDTDRQRVVLFGGETSDNTPQADTWEWDGTTWKQAETAISPPSRAFAAAAYDPISHRVVVTGGLALERGYHYRDDTWFWDGTSWQAGPAQPGPREGSTLAVDPQHGLVLVGGGVDVLLVGFQHADTRVLRGSSWVSLGASTPSDRHGHAAWYDPSVGRIVVAGGLGGTHDPLDYEAWPANDELVSIAIGDTSVTHAELTPLAGPANRAHTHVSYDERRGRVIVFGGIGVSNGVVFRDTWELVDDAWVRVEDGPSAVSSLGAMTYDGRLDRTLGFGGNPYSGDAGVWAWNGATWLYAAPAGDAPEPRTGPAAAFDRDEGVTMMFGGLSWANGQPLQDTWTWNGTRWSKHLGPAPTARSTHAMAYDEAGKRVVMFGGAATNDTWMWSRASGWTQLVSPLAPPARSSAAMTYDPLRDEILLAGGDSVAFDLWRFKDGHWSAMVAHGGPTDRSGIGLVYDRRNARFVMVGTNDDTPLTYTLRWESSTPDEVCHLPLDLDRDGLSSCADPDCSAKCEEP